MQTESTILSSFWWVLDTLTDKEKNVMERRVGLNWSRETLQSIWNSFSPSITRERVRQIEASWINKIWRIIKWTKLIEIQELSRNIIKVHWWILSSKKLVNVLISELNLSKEFNTGVLEIIVQSDFDIQKSKPKLWVETYFYLPSISKKSIDAVYKEWLKILKKRKDVMDKNSLYELIKVNLSSIFPNLTTVFIDSVLDLYEDIVKWEETLIWLTKWKILNPKTLKDKAVYVMKKVKVPMHFVDISNEITKQLWDTVKVNTIHNELIRNVDFVLVWRGIYALKEWGFKPGTVLDVIMDILAKSGEPMTTDTIVAKVLKTRNVKNTTIYMNLQNKKYIERVWRNYYKLKD